MKTNIRLRGTLVGVLASAVLMSGCVVHEHGHGHRHGHSYGYVGTQVTVASGHVCTDGCDHYHGGGHWYRVPHHRHGPGCGHGLRGGVWVTVP